MADGTNNKTTKDTNPLYEHKVFISRKDSTSKFVARNLEFMPQGKQHIGSSINATKALMSNIGEMEKFMPSIIGISKTHPDFYTRLSNYFNSIHVNVPDHDLPLNCNFIFTNVELKAKYEKALSTIISKFDKTDKSTPKLRDEAFEVRDSAIFKLQSDNYDNGQPYNLHDYILYRYCIKYSVIANDISLINSKGNINFYMIDSKLEASRNKYIQDMKDQALEVFAEYFADINKLTNLLYAAGVKNVSGMSKSDKNAQLQALLNNNPSKLVELSLDKTLVKKAKIERYINASILKRYPNTNNIVDQDDEPIGQNINEVIAYMNNPENKGIVSEWDNKLNTIKIQ